MTERVWQLQDAKNKFSEVVERAEEGEPQVVTKRGKRSVVVVSASAYDRLVESGPTGFGESFRDFLLGGPKIEGGLPSKKRTRPKPRDPFEDE